MRKLASVRVVSEIRPIVGADAIECVVVDGWTVVSKKGDFKAGDKCVYFEIDSVLPEREAYEFLRKSCYVKRDWIEGFRLRTAKFRGQLSQGLVLPLDAVKEAVDAYVAAGSPDLSVERFDLTEILEVQKWDPPLPAQLAGLVRGYFPSFIRTTDQERCQNMVDEIFGVNLSARWEVSVKLDGASMTVYRNADDNGVCSRNLSLKLEDDANSFVSTAKRMKLVEALAIVKQNIALQGELMGPSIQGNREKLRRAEFFLFDIFDIDASCYLPPYQRQNLVTQIVAAQRSLGVAEDDLIKHCPVLHSGITLNDLGIKVLDDLIKLADGPSLNAAIREGLVFKRADGRVSFKAISNQFLLKYEE